MKILLAAPQDKTALGIISSYCKKALEALGNEVSIFDFRQRLYSKWKFVSYLKSTVRPFFTSLPSPYDLPVIKPAIDRKINQMLLNYAYEYKPDVLLVLCGENILPKTIVEIKKKLEAIVVNWFHDTLLSPFRQKMIHSIFPFYDHIFIVDSKDVLKYVNIESKNIHTLSLACDPDVHRRNDLSQEDLNEYGSDIVFVGTLTPEREKILETLTDFDLNIWGRWQRQSPQLKRCYKRQDVYLKEAVKIYNASKIVIDIHSLYGKVKDIFNVTPRLFEVPASGGFLLTNHISQVHDFYKVGEEIVTYKDINELKYLIRYFLERPKERKSIAEKAYQRAHREHTYIQRLKTLLDKIKN